MAGSVVSYQSQEVLNVSRDYRSSPVVDKSSVAGANQDRVEDSYDHLNAKAGGPVRSPNNATMPDEEDEMYAFSPKGKAAIAEAARGSGKTTANAAKVPSRAQNGVSGHHEESRPGLAMKGHSIMDELLTNGAKAKSSQIEQHRARLAGRRAEGRSARASMNTTRADAV